MAKKQRSFGSRKKLPKYWPEIQRLSGKLESGTIQHVTVRHDDWCATYRGKDCNCNPIVSLGHPKKSELEAMADIVRKYRQTRQGQR